MQYNRKDPAEEALKEQAKKQVASKAKKAIGKKVANSAAGKAVNEGFKKIVMGLAGGSAPLWIIFIAIILVLCILPATIFSSTHANDSASGDDTLPSTTVIGDSWDEDEARAIQDAKNALEYSLFWEDLGTFFTTGKWGTETETFRTELANASDEASVGYFSSSNKLVAIINEIYRRGADSSGAQQKARAQALMSQNEEVQYAIDNYGVDSGHVVYHTPTLRPAEDTNYLMQTTYLIAACSYQRFENDDFDIGTRQMLNFAFDLTGARKGSSISDAFVWEPAHDTVWEERYESEIVRYEIKKDAEGLPILNDMGEPEMEPVYEDVLYIDIYVEYYCVLRGDYKDSIHRLIGLNESDEDFSETTGYIQEQSVQLLKFYRESYVALEGDLGLPLPAGTYLMSHRLGCGCSTHKGTHTGQDLSAPNGTPILSIADGTVIVAHVWQGGESGLDSYGNYVVVDHGTTPDGHSIITLYAHMDYMLVSVGEEVTIGTQLGGVGNTGNSKGNHLHFEYKVDGVQVDPMQGELGIAIEENSNGRLNDGWS